MCDDETVSLPAGEPDTFTGQGKPFILTIVFGKVVFQTLNLVIKQTVGVMRTLAIGSSGSVHLEKPQIDPHLNQFSPIFPFNLSNHRLAGLIRPAIQHMRYVQLLHEGSLTRSHRAVNERLEPLSRLKKRSI